MISLDNTYSLEEVADFEQRMRNVLKEHSPQEFDYYVQPKYDGLGLAVIYSYGKLTQAITRGSGVEGEDVTLGAFEIKNIPKEILELKDVERMEIRGEVMMSRTTFQKVNNERMGKWEKLFANPRNAASWSLRQLDPLITRSRDLQFFAYAIPQIEQDEDDSMRMIKYGWLMNLLSVWGFERQDFPFTLIHGLKNLLTLIDNETSNKKEYFDFDIDGMVLKLDDMTLWDNLGRTEHHPRYAIAYKFPAKQVRTRVISIEHSVGRTGTVTPVANLEAVDVGWVVVRRATLHNYDELTKKWVREGDYVFIMRAGEVIPEIVTVLTDLRNGSEKEVNPPEVCPVCSTGLLQDIWKVAVFCPNSHCPAKIQGQLEMFVGKQWMNIDGLGARQIELFLELGWITDFVSVFQLEKYRENLLSLEWYKEKSVNNLVESINKARHTTLDRVFTAIWIPNVGKKTGKIIMNHELWLMSLSEGRTLLECIFSTTEEDLLSMKDIGPETARAFVEYMKENKEMIEKLFLELQIQVPERILSSSGLQNQWRFQWKSFCVTGSFEGISRDEIHEIIEKNGGEVRSAVTGKLDFLIVWENAGSKKSKANDLGVKCLSLEEFHSMHL